MVAKSLYLLKVKKNAMTDNGQIQNLSSLSTSFKFIYNLNIYLDDILGLYDANLGSMMHSP